MVLCDDWKSNIASTISDQSGSDDGRERSVTLDEIKTIVNDGIASCSKRGSSRLGLDLPHSIADSELLDQVAKWCDDENLAFYVRHSGTGPLAVTIAPKNG